jgi:DNA-binding winged helix-turn-helix (wHTH) protein
MRLRCGDCLLDFGTRELHRGRAQVPVSPKAFALLELLALRRPNAISKEEIHRHLWPDSFVADGNLANLVTELRDALGEDARHPRVIRTVQRFGYAFAGDAQPDVEPVRSVAADNVVFKLVWADREISLQEGENILGREREAIAWIDVHSVSRRHARIVVSGDRATLEDLGSKNGTFLGGERVEKPSDLRDGDRLRIGTVEMTLRRYVGGVSTESTRHP